MSTVWLGGNGPAGTASGARTRPLSPVDCQPVTLGRVIAAEWTKWWTLRSSPIVLGVAMLAMPVFGVVVAYNTRHVTGNLQPNDLAPSSTLQGYYLGQLLIGVLGVLFVSGEYGTGSIRSTLVAVPRRLPVLWAKLIVFLAVTATAMIAVSLIAFLAAQGFLSRYRTGFSLGDPGVARVVIGTGVYLTLVGVIGGALGWIVRSTAGALASYIGVILVLPVLFGNALGTWGKHIAQYLPTPAGAAFSNSIPDAHPSLSPWVGLAVMALWAVVGVAVAAAVLRRRDA